MSRFLHTIEEFWKASLPVASCIFFVLMMLMPLSIHGPLVTVKMILSAFPLMALCFWIVNQPEHFGVGWSFIIGFMQDVLLGQPLGMTALAYLGADFFLRGQGHFFLQQSFQHLWMMFAVVMVGVSAVQWLIASLMMHNWIDVMPMLVRVALGILFFPLVAFLLHQMQRSVFGRA
ncbi:MAG: rod shape-determining protein MreD [Alphaproteobacteria bacterium]|nr:rod shape-determining protein MreD [Alphaproteobacteria bacterium]